MATVALWALNRSLASNISGHWGQTDLEFSPQEILNRSDPEAPGPRGSRPRGSPRGSRSPARAALAYLAKHHTEATRAELVPILGLSRPESVPNLSARFAALLQSESNARRDLLALERALGLSGENSKSV